MARPGTLIIGSGGMLGCELVAACRRRGVDARGIDGPVELDITDADAVKRVLGGDPRQVVINATGYTDVNGAESDPETAMQVNQAGPRNLARVCRSIGATLVHYSTDFIFDGSVDRPLRPDDPPNPINIYGVTKLAGEREVVDSGCDHLVLRTSWLFASQGCNFVRTVLDLAAERDCLEMVDDQQGCPTYAADLAEMTLGLLDAEARGTLHVANGGRASWYDFAVAICEMARLDCTIRRCSMSDYPQAAARPPFTVLDLSRTEAIIGPPRHWRDALADCLVRSAT